MIVCKKFDISIRFLLQRYHVFSFSFNGPNCPNDVINNSMKGELFVSWLQLWSGVRPKKQALLQSYLLYTYPITSIKQKKHFNQFNYCSLQEFPTVHLCTVLPSQYIQKTNRYACPQVFIRTKRAYLWLQQCIYI